MTPKDTVVEVLYADEWVPTTIVDQLSAQFTVELEGRIQFYLHCDKGDTWRDM